MAKNDWEIRRLDYMARWYPLVATGLVQITVDEFLQRFKRHMINELGHAQKRISHGPNSTSLR